MRKLFLILMTLMACSWQLMAQSHTYRGTVVDAESNEPLIGATIMPIGGGQGAAADIDGHFSVTVPAKVKKATVSYVGYVSQTVELHDGMKVALASTSKSLDDLVVVAYGTANKESLTGSVAVVGSKEIEDRPVTSVTAALEGNAPGVQVNNSVGAPGSSPTIRIRGFNSINGSNTPLYVVDGVPYEGSISDLNPADIESMSVLKDAASSALYGNRGANGVVLITTKKAKNVGKVDVTLQIRQGMYNRGLPFYDRVNPNEWMETALAGYANGLQAQKNTPFPTKELAMDFAKRYFVANISKINLYGVPDDQLFDEAGKLIPTSILPGYENDLDWWDAVSRSGYRQEYNVSAAAATDKFNIFASAAYLKENGYMLRTDFERFNGRLNANFQPTSYLRFGVNLAATQQESMTDGISDTAAVNNPFLTMFMAPIYPYYQHDENGDVIYSDGQPVWNSANYLQNNNVAQSMRLDDDKFSATVIDGNIYGTAIIPYGFELTVRGAIHRDKTNSRSYINREIGSARGVGSLQTGYQDIRSHTFMQTLTWNHDFGIHHVDVLLDHENWQYTALSASVNKNGQLLDDMLYLSNFENLLAANESAAKLTTESYLGRVRYNYDQKYFGEVSVRRDGSSRFSKNHRWGTFWSVGASWVISREKFMHNLAWVNYLKLRAAYGSVGNDASAGSLAYRSLSAFGMPIGGVSNLLPGSNGAPDLKWEATNTFDIALEGSLFNDRFDFSVGYFNKRNSDLIFNMTLPGSAGMLGTSGSSMTIATNVGTMQNIGWELQFGYDIIRNRDWKWNVSLDATFMKNKIIKLPYNHDLASQGLFLQKSIYEHYNYTYAGVDQLNGRALYEVDRNSPDFTYYNADGSIDEAQSQALWEQNLKLGERDGAFVTIDDKLYTYNCNYAGRKLQGTSLPTVYGSFGTSASWKGLSLSLLFTYSLGGKTYDSNYSQLMSVGNSASALHKDILKSWTVAPEGVDENSPASLRIDPNGIPQVNNELSQYNNGSSSRWLTSSNYLCLKNIMLSYDLPKKWMDAIKLQGISVGASVDNLFLVTRRKGMNPQQSWAGGQDAYYVPARVFSFQLSAKF